MCAALACAQRGLSVQIYEPRSGPLDKACGEGIMPAGVRILEELGVAVPREGQDSSSLSDSPDAMKMWAKGREAFDRARWDDAARHFEAATALDSEFAQAHLYHGWALWWRDGLYRESSQDRAEEALNRAAGVQRLRYLRREIATILPKRLKTSLRALGAH